MCVDRRLAVAGFSRAVVQSSRMAVSRLRCVGILLFVLSLTADMATAGFCSGELLDASATAVTISAGDHSDATSPCCTGHQCFCCFSGAQVVMFELPIEDQTAIVPPPPAPHAPDNSVARTSPPPRR